MALLFFVLGGFIVVGKFFVQLWAGKENIEAYYLVIIMVLPSIIPLCQNVGIEIQKAMNKHVFRSIVYVIFAIINILITIIGSIHFGLIGASMGYVVAIVFANGILMNWYYYKKIQLNIKRYWIQTVKIIIPFFVSISLFLFLQLRWNVDSMGKFVLFGIGYSVTYVLVYVRFVMNKYEKDVLSRFTRSRF